MAPIANLYSNYAYPDVGSNFPIVIIMHGFAGAAYTSTILTRIARYGLFVAGVGMRGRNGASGSQDASGREAYDIYDVLAKIRTTYASVVDPNIAAVVGYSGGGGNALACAAKFPDAWAMIASFFGMSDYGRNNPNGWYYNGGDTATLDTWIGGNPGTVPDNYFSRDATCALGTNYSGGMLHLFHDDQDGTVPIIHSQRAATSMTNAGRTNYAAHYTTTTDSPRWIHGNPAVGDPGEPNIQAEPIWAAQLAAKTYPAWTVPVAGTVNVIGYCKTKRFEIRLGTLADEAADVAYDTTIDQYVVTPQTGSMLVNITQGAKSVSQTISSTTVITVT